MTDAEAAGSCAWGGDSYRDDMPFVPPFIDAHAYTYSVTGLLYPRIYNTPYCNNLGVLSSSVIHTSRSTT